jgi:hypothetical protein
MAKEGDVRGFRSNRLQRKKRHGAALANIVLVWSLHGCVVILSRMRRCVRWVEEKERFDGCVPVPGAYVPETGTPSPFPTGSEL